MANGVKPSRSRRVPTAVLGLVVVGALVLSGCRGGSIDLTVRSEGSGTLVVEIFPETEVRKALEDVALDAMVESSADAAGRVDFTEVNVNGRRGYRVEVDFDSYDDLEPVLVGGFEVTGQRIQLFREFDLREVDGSWYLDAVINPVSEMLAGLPADTTRISLGEVLSTVGNVSGRTGIRLTIVLPGEIINANTSTRTGGGATWALDRLEAPMPLTMTTQPEEFPTTAQLVIGAGIALLLVGVVLSFWGAARPHDSERARRRRKKSRTFGQEGATPPGRPVGWTPTPATVPGFGAGPQQPSNERPTPLPPLTAPASDAAPEPVTVAEPEPVPEPVAAGDASHVTDAAHAPGTFDLPDEAAEHANPPAGWYPDPAGSGQRRFWDGEDWTDHLG